MLTDGTKGREASAASRRPPAPDLVAAILGSAPINLFAFDPEGDVLYAEGSVLPKLRDGRPICAGASMHDCVADEGDFDTPVKASLQGQPGVATLRFGTTYLEITLHPVGEPGAPSSQVIGVGVDVTAYREALAAVRDREERLRSIVDAVLDGILVVDEQGRVESLNPAAARMFGFSAGAVIGRPATMLVPALDEIAAAPPPADGGGPSQGIGTGRETEGRRRDGSSFPIDIALKDLTRGSRRLTIATVRDVTAQKQAESDLRRSQERYALAARGSTDGLWDWDLVGDSFY